MRAATVFSIDAELLKRAVRREIAPFVALRRRLCGAYGLGALLVLDDAVASPAFANASHGSGGVPGN